MQEMICRAMALEDIHPHMMDRFRRHQSITREFRQARDGTLHCRMRKEPRIEDWDARGTFLFIKNWFTPKTAWVSRLGLDETVFAAFEGNQVKGFAMLADKQDGKWYGTRGKTQVLLRLYISADCRRQGIGRSLFALCAEAARQQGAETIFISADCAAETIAFYQALGCTPAKEDIRKELHSPKTDIPLAYLLLSPVHNTQ